MKRIIGCCLLLIFVVCTGFGQENRWKIKDQGAITWQPDTRLPHHDHLEMSGRQVAAVLRYGVTADTAFVINKSLVWPMLRTIPNNTHASLMRRFGWNPLDMITLNGRTIEKERVQEVRLNGTLEVVSQVPVYWKGQAEIRRTFFPAADAPALLEEYVVRNTGGQEIRIEIPAYHSVQLTDSKQGVTGSYRIETGITKAGIYVLNSGDSLCFGAYTAAYPENVKSVSWNIPDEKSRRMTLVDGWLNNLVLETPDPVINTMFAFSKIRACESIYQTQQGPMHGPGGESYYAAVWANDQAEYINPYFPFTGYAYGNESALNAFRHFARYMNAEYQPIPSSIVAEGLDYWNGAGDRGDAAMIAYGAARYALTLGNREVAAELWTLIEWCLEYCHRKLNKDGVVSSDSDELENRFPSGDANLCTSSLYYDALISATCLGKQLGKPSAEIQAYVRQAKQLRKAIELYFGAEVEGFQTYAYYEGNQVLRSWICIPLTVGITERSAGTIEALFSPRLWTSDGLLTEAGSETFWDRSTLYALRGVYIAGETERATDYLHYYSATRLLGEHVPYAIEAWPEGSQRHLSAESGLYGRIIAEGLFGIRPTGLNSFTCTPRLPAVWNNMALKNIKAFGQSFNIQVKRVTRGLHLQITSGDRTVYDRIIPENTTVNCQLSNVK